MGKFKSFTPRVDTKRRLVMTRFYAGVNNYNSFCYMIHRTTKKGTIDKKFKFLYQKHILAVYEYEFASGRLPLEVALEYAHDNVIDT